MVPETDDWNFDEDTQDDTQDMERPTVPDLTVESVHAMRSSIKEIRYLSDKDLSELPRKEEVKRRICAHAKLGDDSLMNLEMDEADGPLTFAECRLKDVNFAYVYIDKDCKTPSYASFEDSKLRIPIKHPGATVLLRVKRKGKPVEVYRWED